MPWFEPTERPLFLLKKGCFKYWLWSLKLIPNSGWVTGPSYQAKQAPFSPEKGMLQVLAMESEAVFCSPIQFGWLVGTWYQATSRHKKWVVQAVGKGCSEVDIDACGVVDSERLTVQETCVGMLFGPSTAVHLVSSCPAHLVCQQWIGDCVRRWKWIG